MELEEMVQIWSKMSDQIEKQKKLTDNMIIMMTQDRYRKKINKIEYPEIIGAIICYATAILILANIPKLDNWYTLMSGIICVIILLILPVLSLKSIHQMKKIDIVKNNYKETLITYSKSRKRFMWVTKMGFYLGFILLFLILPVTTKILNNKDIFDTTKSFWSLGISILCGVVFFIVFAKWVGKKYMKNIRSAEQLLKDLEENENL